MKKSIIIILAGAFCLVIAGCSVACFYSDTALTKKTGLKYYTVKPYLMIERDPMANTVVALAALKAPAAAVPVTVTELYDIIMTGGEPTLRRIEIVGR